MKELEIDHVSEHVLNLGTAPSSEGKLQERNPMDKRLKATWDGAREPGDEPSNVCWEDGRSATLEDFHAHELDTHFWAEDDDGRLSKFMFPDIVAGVVFVQAIKDWVVHGEGVVATALGLADPNASEENIIAALFTLDTVYRSRIIRCQGGECR